MEGCRSCYWYHKGKTFQANHNADSNYCQGDDVVIDTTKVRLFKQITTQGDDPILYMRCYWYHKGKTFQANHNMKLHLMIKLIVVIDTTKVRLFKQITTQGDDPILYMRCYWYHKGKTFQANHNKSHVFEVSSEVVIDTTKVRLFKQITTPSLNWPNIDE